MGLVCGQGTTWKEKLMANSGVEREVCVRTGRSGWRKVFSQCLVVLLCGTAAAHAVAEEHYFGYLPQGGSWILVGFEDGTTYTIDDLETGAVSEGTIDRYERRVLSTGPTRYFELVTSAPLLALAGYDCCNIWGNFFYPTLDGKKYYGTRFVVSPPVMGGGYGILMTLFARDDANVVISTPDGQEVASRTMTAGSYWNPPGISGGAVYDIVATGLIAVHHSTPNGYNQVPPVPLENELQDCNDDDGYLFYFATDSWATGTVAVFNYGEETAIFSIRLVWCSPAGGDGHGHRPADNVDLAPNLGYMEDGAPNRRRRT